MPINLANFKQPTKVVPALKGKFSLGGLDVIQPGVSRRKGAIHVDAAQIAETGSPEPDERFAGCFALPGLVDMHIHLPPNNFLKLTRHAVAMYLLHGITTVREAGDLDGTSLNGYDALPKTFPRPRSLHSGPFVGAGRKTFKNIVSIKSPNEAQYAVDRVKAAGASFLKLYDGLSKEMIEALRERAGAAGLKTFGHVPSDLSFEESGVDEVQHFFGVPQPQNLQKDTLIHRAIDWRSVDEPRIDQIVEQSLAKGISNTPTLAAVDGMLAYRDYDRALDEKTARMMPHMFPHVVWNPNGGGLNNKFTHAQLDRDVPEALEKKQSLLTKLHAAGAAVFLGTDTMQPFLAPGIALHREMQLFAEAGIAPEEVWRLATQSAGERLGIPQLGTLEPGAPADILLFDRDPTQDLSDLSTLRAVVRDGALYEVATLRRAVDAMLGYFDSFPVRQLATYGAKKALAKTLRRTRAK